MILSAIRYDRATARLSALRIALPPLCLRPLLRCFLLRVIATLVTHATPAARGCAFCARLRTFHFMMLSASP